MMRQLHGCAVSFIQTYIHTSRVIEGLQPHAYCKSAQLNTHLLHSQQHSASPQPPPPLNHLLPPPSPNPQPHLAVVAALDDQDLVPHALPHVAIAAAPRCRHRHEHHTTQVWGGLVELEEGRRWRGGVEGWQEQYGQEQVCIRQSC